MAILAALRRLAPGTCLGFGYVQLVQSDVLHGATMVCRPFENTWPEY